MSDHQAIFRTLSDRWWRLNNLYHIKDDGGNRVVFSLNPAQQALYRGMHNRNVILKARQLGFTTFIQIYALDACLFYPYTNAGIIAHTLVDAETFFTDKIRFAYDNLSPAIKEMCPASQDSAKTLRFANGSMIRVGTSLRSGTYQILHISEYGKLCARYPEKAREVRTGALNTLHAGSVAFIESTAEGQEGHYYELCRKAQEMAASGKALTELDPKFHFFPWWGDARYAIDPEGVPIPAPLDKYFDALASEHDILLTDAQKAWYALKSAEQGDDMKREFPSTPGEAFEASIVGAYYAGDIARAYRDGRVGKVPVDPSLEVHSHWDLGMNDSMSIWLHQRHGKENRFVGFYQNSGEGMAHYIRWIKDWAAERSAVLGRAHMPHDVEVKEMGTGKSRKQTAEDLGLRDIVVVPRTDSVNDDIQAARNKFGSCWFDEEACAEGLHALKNYRKEWDENNGVFKNRPLHNWASHPADAFRTFAVGFDDDEFKADFEINTRWVV